MKMIRHLSFEDWVEEKKVINNNLAVPLYRKFCSEYGLKLHFGDEIKNFNPDKHAPIVLDETPLHGEAMALFNFVNRYYHPYEKGLVSFVYTDWGGDFDYEILPLEKVASEMELKDVDIKRLKYESATFSTIAVFSTSVLLALIAISITKIQILSILIFVGSLVLLPIAVLSIYKRREKTEQHKFDRKLLELQKKLKKIYLKYEHSVVINTKTQPFNPNEFSTLVKYDSQKIEDATQKLMKNHSMTRHQAMVGLEQDLSEIESR